MIRRTQRLITKSLQILLMSFLLAVIAAYSVQAAEAEIYITIRADGLGLYEAIVTIANNPGIAGYDIVMEFDNTILTPVSIEEGDTLGGMIFISNMSGATEERIAEMDAVTAVWGAAVDNDENGVIYTVLFRASEAATGSTKLRLVSRGIGNAAGQAVDFTLIGAEIDFGGDYIFYDVSDDEPDEGVANPANIALLLVIALLVMIIIILIIIIVIKSRKRKYGSKMYRPRG